jgi:tetratricopeptide (TPR) repeat protein
VESQEPKIKDRENIMNAPSIASLTADFLTAQIEFGEMSFSEVDAYNITAGLRADPKQAWADAQAAAGIQVNQVPTEWATFVWWHETAYAIPMAAGEYPQRLRELGILLSEKNLSALPTPRASTLPAGMQRWIEKAKLGSFDQLVMAAALLRSAGEFHRAQEYLDLAETKDASKRDVIANERATLHWFANDRAKAVEMWSKIDHHPASQFNQGVAALFNGEKVKAKTFLKQAQKMLPENSPWYDLASLYLSISEIE